MQTLGLSNTLKSESRIKSLFWPSIQNTSDVDYLGAQGFWICSIVGVVSLPFLIAMGHPILAVAALVFYFIGGVGVRERSRYAAAIVFLVYAFDAVVAGPNVVRVLFTALLLSNLRATWISAVWERGAGEPVMAPRFGDTWTEKLADQLPMKLWPKAKIPFYVYSGGYALLEVLGVALYMAGARPH